MIAFVSSFPFLSFFFELFWLVGWLLLLLLFFFSVIAFSQSLTGTFFEPFNEIH